MTAGKVTSRGLVDAYLARIAAYDASDDASSLAEEPTMDSRGPLLDFGPAVLSCETSVACGLLLFRPSIATSLGAAAAASCCVKPRAGARSG